MAIRLLVFPPKFFFRWRKKEALAQRLGVQRGQKLLAFSRLIFMGSALGIKEKPVYI